MTKTLDDMSTEERANCVGMWCEVGDGLEILAEPDGMVDYHDTAILYSPKRGSADYVLAKNVTPRFDLPRAWTPEGEPELAQALAEETWEYIVQVKRSDQWQFYIGESRLPTDKPGLANGFSEFEHALEFSKMETEYPTRIVRRRVSPPEVINE